MVWKDKSKNMVKGREVRTARLGTAVVISGPSGVGKSTLLAALRRRHPALRFSISCTTRPPRRGETHGVHYYFLEPEEFERRLAEQAFVEHAAVFEHYYGTLKRELLDPVLAGEDVCLDIDVQGAMQIREALEREELLRRCCEFIFLAPPSLAELERRLRSRATDSAGQIALRLGKAREELAFWPRYDYLVINDVLERAVDELELLLEAFRRKTSRLPDGYFDEK